MSELQNKKEKILNKVILIARSDLPTMTQMLIVKQAMMGMSQMLSTQAGIGIDVCSYSINDSNTIDIGFGDSNTIDIGFGDFNSIMKLHEDKELKQSIGLCMSNIISDYTYPFKVTTDVAKLLEYMDNVIGEDDCIKLDMNSEDENSMVCCTRHEKTGLIMKFTGTETKYEELIDMMTEYGIEMIK